MRYYILPLLLFLCFASQVRGQRGGESTYAYLQLPISPRIAALGGKVPGYGGEKDLSLSVANPAFAHHRLHNAVEVSGSLFFADVKYSYASYFHAIDSSLTLGGHFRQMWYGDFVRRDERGEEMGHFRAFEMAVGLHASYQLPRGWSVGTTLTPLYSSLERYWSLGLACDLAVGYSDSAGLVSVGLVAQNIGGTLKTYSGRHEDTPFELLAGAKIRMRYAPIVFVFTLQHLENWQRRFIRESAYDGALANGVDPKERPSVWQHISSEILAHPIVGVEFHPSRYFFVQGSYNHGRRMAMITPSQYSLEGFAWGFGIQIRRLAVRFSRAVYHATGASNHLSVAFYFSGGRDAAMRPHATPSRKVEAPTDELLEDEEKETL